MRKFNQIVLTGAASALIGLLAVTGCSTFQRGDGERTAGRVVDDNRITSQVKDKLDDEPVFKFDDVEVNTFRGVVQLSGFVNTEDQKQRAEQIAQGIPGVARVVNSLALKTEPATPTGRTNTVNQPSSAPIQSDSLSSPQNQ